MISWQKFRYLICGIALASSIPFALMAQGSESDAPTRVTLLPSGEIRVTGDFIVELNETDRVAVANLAASPNERSFSVQGAVHIENESLSLTTEDARINLSSGILSGARSVVISRKSGP